MRKTMKNFFGAVATATALTVPAAATADGLNLNLNLDLGNGQVTLNGGNITIRGNNGTIRGTFGNGAGSNDGLAATRCRQRVTSDYKAMYGWMYKGTPEYRAYQNALRSCGRPGR